MDGREMQRVRRVRVWIFMVVMCVLCAIETIRFVSKVTVIAPWLETKMVSYQIIDETLTNGE